MTNIQKKRSDEHPSVRAARARLPVVGPAPISAETLRQWAIEAGADDAAAVSLEHPELEEERAPVRKAFAAARSLVSIVVKMHADNVRSPARSVANNEFHHAGDRANEVARALVERIAAAGHRALNPAMAFPMEMDDFPGRTWIVSHKRVAVAGQLGRMGLHRNVIHPRFGSFIVLATVLTSVPVDEATAALDFNPCIDCKLCVAACPVGAIEADGAFRFSACLDHNYREFMSGFGDLLEEAVESRDRHELRERVPLSEMASMWQSLAYRPNYKAAYCIAVCPAGDDVIGPFVENRAKFKTEVLAPLTERKETVYVVEGSDAEAHAARRFPHKRVRRVRSSLRATSVAGLFRAMPLIFQRGPAKGWKGTFHFELTDRDASVHRATVRIEDGALSVDPTQLVGEANVTVRGDAQSWLDVVSKKRNPVLLVLRGKLSIRGDRSLLDRFAKCFPR
ncbi:MAG: SCP2 sterol-binding domain-containing protein [Myxococcales bacterium]|nr:SCP2 sterol-binding domain-containing protein [Myxococcales bacterium]